MWGEGDPTVQQNHLGLYIMQENIIISIYTLPRETYPPPIFYI